MTINSISAFLGTLHKFTPKGQNAVIETLKEFRYYAEIEGETLQESLKLCEIPEYLMYLGKKEKIEAELINKSDTIEKLINELIDKIKTFGVSRTKRTAKNIKTGMQEPLNIEGITSWEGNSSRKINAYNIDGKIVGKAELMKPYMPLFNALGLTPSLEIRFFATSPNYNGIGTAMVSKIVEISKKLGYGGHVHLTASTGCVPKEFVRICGPKKCSKAAAIQYHKMGFVSDTPEIESKIVDEIKNGQNGIRYKNGIPTDIVVGKMDLSEEAIKKYLG